MTPMRRRMIVDLMLRSRAPRPIRTFAECVGDFGQYAKVSPKNLGPEQVRSYLLHLVQDRRLSWSCYNQAGYALQFLYRVTLGKDWVVEEVACPKLPFTSPWLPPTP